MNEAAGPERKTKRQLQEVAIFNDVAKALTSSLNLDSILQTIMDKMAEFFRPDTWSLLMVDEQKTSSISPLPWAMPPKRSRRCG
jgi:transcriptional regulator with GAF, ATPase, and Fis domain